MTTTLMRSARARGWVVLAGLLILGVAILWGLVIFVWSVLAGTGPGQPSRRPHCGHAQHHRLRATVAFDVDLVVG